MNESMDSLLCSRMKKLEQFYTTVLSMTFSDDGKYLIASLKNGKLAIFMIEKLSRYTDEPITHDQLSPKPINIIQAHDDAIYSLITIDDLIVSAGDGEIKAWRLQNLIESERPRPEWIQTIFPKNSLSNPEINSIIYTGENTQMIAAGCGDKKIYCYDIGSSLPKMILTGHEDYINCLSYSLSLNLIFSGSEDGSVRLWDTRNGKEVQRIEPFKIQDLNRPHGKWIGSVALDTNSDWMVCGGGPHLTSWHVRSLSKGQIYRSSIDSTSNQAIVHENLIISGGNTRYVSVFEMNGDVNIEIPCKPFSIFGLALNVNERGSQLAVGGCSNSIDVKVLGKKGPLAKLWLAAHVLKKMKKHDIQSVNVEAAVESLLSPRIPISLRTLSHLMVGVTVIHNRQVMYLLTDLEHLRKISKLRFCGDGNVDAPETKLQARISDINLPDVVEMNHAGVFINHMEIDRSRIVNQLIRPDLGSGLTNEPNLKAVWKSFSDEYTGSQDVGPQMAKSLSDIIFEDSVVTDDGFGGRVDKSVDEIFGSVILTGEPVPEPAGPIGLDSSFFEQPTQELLSPQEFTQPAEQASQQEENIEQDPQLNGHRSPLVQEEADLLQVPEAEKSALEIGRRGSRSARSILGDSPLVLEPVEAGPEIRPRRSRNKRAKRVIIDENIVIPPRQLKSQLTNTSDLIAPRELRFVSKYHAEMERLSHVKLLYSSSSIKLNSQCLKKIFEQRLQTRPVEIEEALSPESEAEARDEPDAVHEELLLEPLEEDALQVDQRTIGEKSRPSQSKDPKKGRRRSRKEAEGGDEPSPSISKRSRTVGPVPSRISEVPRRASSGEADDMEMDYFDDDKMSVISGQSDIYPKPLSTQEIDNFIAEIERSSGSSVCFSDLVIGNRRREVAAKFYQILVLHKRRLVKLEQRKNYDQIYIHKMQSLIAVI